VCYVDQDRVIIKLLVFWNTRWQRELYTESSKNHYKVSRQYEAEHNILQQTINSLRSFLLSSWSRGLFWGLQGLVFRCVVDGRRDVLGPNSI